MLTPPTLSEFQIDCIKHSDEKVIKLAADFGLTPNQVLDIQCGVAVRGHSDFKLGRGPGNQGAVDEILAGGVTPLGQPLEVSGYRTILTDEGEERIPYGPRGQDMINSWEKLHEAK